MRGETGDSEEGYFCVWAKSSVPWDSLLEWNVTQMKNGSDIHPRGQLPHYDCFSELDKSAQGSSVMLSVAVGGDLSLSHKGPVLVNVRFHPLPGIYDIRRRSV